MIPGIVTSLLIHNDTLFIGGQFQNATNHSHVAYHADGTWHYYGNFSSAVNRLVVIEDTLYACGVFTEVDGNPTPGVAKRVGGHWIGVGPVLPGGSSVGDLVKYNGRLVRTSNMTIDGIMRIHEFVDGQWVGLGPGIQGGLGGAKRLAVYQGDLYVSGQFTPVAGNAGKEIMRWDGEQFHSLGSGLERALGDQTSFCTGADMIVHDGFLWVAGGCNFAGGIPASGIARWDGTEWCGGPGSLGVPANGVSNIAFYRDTLFASVFVPQIDGVFVNYLAKIIGEEFVEVCSGPVGMAELNSQDSPVHAYSLGDGQWIFSGLEPGMYSYRVVDMLGRTMVRSQFVVNDRWSPPINLSPLANGVHTVLFDK